MLSPRDWGSKLKKAPLRSFNGTRNSPAAIYAMITIGRAYDEKEAFKLTPSSQAKRLQNLQKQAHALGMQLAAA